MYTWREMLKKTPLTLPKDWPSQVPLLDVAGAVLMPKGQLPVTLETRHAPVMRRVMGSDRLIGVVQSHAEKNTHSPPENLFQTGCLGRISALSESQDGTDLVILTGLARFRVLKCSRQESGLSILNVTYAPFSFDGVDHGERVEDRETFLEIVRGYCHLHDITPNWEEVLRSNDEALVTSLAMMCPFSAREKQALLEVPTLRDREKMMTALMEVACLKEGLQKAHLH